MNHWQELLSQSRTKIRSARFAWVKPVLCIALLCLVVMFILLESYGTYQAYHTSTPVAVAVQPQRSPEQWLEENARLEKKIASQKPKEPYLVIDTASNRVTLRSGDEIVRDMLASCGSGKVLEDTSSGRRWVFDTPRGQYRIKSKVTNPLWIKPDWAFLEEGQAIPTKASLRAEPGAMGDYALGIGNGYFIHGTLYKRMLGRNVSHGCVRLGDEDLAHLYRNVPIGTRVFIF